jgi:hypothetical protein
VVIKQKLTIKAKNRGLRLAVYSLLDFDRNLGRLDWRNPLKSECFEISD